MYVASSGIYDSKIQPRYIYIFLYRKKLHVNYCVHYEKILVSVPRLRAKVIGHHEKLSEKRCLARVLDMIVIESLLIDIGNYISSYFCLFCLYCATMVMPIIILICEILQYLTKPGYTYPSCLVRLEQCNTLLCLVSSWFVLYGPKWTTRIHAWFLITLVVIGVYNLLRNTSLQSVKRLFIFIENYICLKLPKTQRQDHAVRGGIPGKKVSPGFNNVMNQTTIASWGHFRVFHHMKCRTIIVHEGIW